MNILTLKWITCIIVISFGNSLLSRTIISSRIVSNHASLIHLSSRKNIDVGASCHFEEEVIQFLIGNNIEWEKRKIYENTNNILAIGSQYDEANDEQKFLLGLHIIPTPDSYEEFMNPSSCKSITDNIGQTPFLSIIHLHEDIWRNKNDIVTARILAKLNRLRNRWYARNTVAKRIPVTLAMKFLEEHHLWGSTRAKFNYGLYLKPKKQEEEKDTLVAVATFSPRRHVSRHHSNRMYRSHELIRYCAKRDEVVLGGITKLLSAFCRDVAPDDIVTCIDRDFGAGEGWSSIGFERVQVMPPLIMVVRKQTNPNFCIERKYLVGAGIDSLDDKKSNSRQGRPGINSTVYSDLQQVTDSGEAIKTLMSHGLCPVYDTGVERRMMIVQKSTLKSHSVLKKEELNLTDILIPDEMSIQDIWDQSTPKFPDHYYSPNAGIALLLQNAVSTDDYNSKSRSFT